jgi:hypothetical protein
MEQETTATIKTMTPNQLFAIWDYQQRIKAKTALLKADRLKKTLTWKEKYNKLAQMGKRLRYKDITFTFTDGMGYLQMPDGKGIAGATISDFAEAVEKEYDKHFKWAE